MDDSTLKYTDTITWLFDLQFFGIKLGLENIREMAARMGDPQRAFHVLHVAGTNGKGSTGSLIAAVLQSAGYRTGLYTSPHLVDFSERIRIDGQPIDEATVVRIAAELRPDVERLNATFFEATTLMAFLHFARNAVDVAVIETGMGGRLDATNIVEPLCCAITNVAMDHTEYLGESIEEIAMEKAGIIKHGIPVVVGPVDESVLHGIRARALEQHAALFEADPAQVISWKDFERMTCALPAPSGNVAVGLVGSHQASNVGTANAVLRILRERGLNRIDEKAIRVGFANVRALTGLRARLQQYCSDPELVVDVAHNPDGIRKMLDAWCGIRDPRKTHAVFGVLKHKDIFGILSILASVPFRSLTLVQPKVREAASLDDLARRVRDGRLVLRTAAGVCEGVHEALRHAGGEPVLLFGSHYVVGEFFAEWEKNPTKRT